MKLNNFKKRIKDGNRILKIKIKIKIKIKCEEGPTGNKKWGKIPPEISSENRRLFRVRRHVCVNGAWHIGICSSPRRSCTTVVDHHVGVRSSSCWGRWQKLLLFCKVNCYFQLLYSSFLILNHSRILIFVWCFVYWQNCFHRQTQTRLFVWYHLHITVNIRYDSQISSISFMFLTWFSCWF